MKITSPHNQKLKEIRKLRQRRRWRERSGLFVAEGEDLLAAADAAGWEAVDRYCVAGSGLAGTEVEPAVLASGSGLASGTRALGVYRERWADRATGPLCIYLHGVQDPGNVGTILRSAEAFGVASVALGPGCADPFSPKAVRASMGAVFAVPVVQIDSPGKLPGLKIALVPGHGVPLPELWRSGCAYLNQIAKVEGGADSQGAGPAGNPDDLTLLLGAEREGLSPEIVSQADLTTHIPTANDSLNVAMAVTVVLYELANRMANG
jgi:RNA methyltransferase, TrmH family